MITDADINLLHGCYCKLTGLSLPMRSICDARRIAWQRFAAAGHTLRDLETVILHLKQGIRDGKRLPGCLRFTNLIEDLDHWEEELALALAEKRNAKPVMGAKEQALRELRPKTVDVNDNVKGAVHISTVIEAMRRAADGKEDEHDTNPTTGTG